MIVCTCLLILALYKSDIKSINEYVENPLNKKMGKSIKGLAAIVVVLHHVIQRIDTHGLLSIFIYIGYFAVSIFLFYTGYGLMYNYKNKHNYLQIFWINRVPKLIIPFILSNIIFIIIYMTRGVKFSILDLGMYIVGIKLIDSFKWYIIATIILYIFYYFILKYTNKKYFILNMFLCITIYVVTLKLMGKEANWYNSIYAFWVGMIFAEYQEDIFKFIKSRYTKCIFITSVLFICVFCLSIIKGDTFIQIIASIFFILLCLCIITKIEISNKLTDFIGGISYEIYLMHRIFIDGVSKDNRYLYLLLCITGSICIGYMLNILSNKSIGLFTKILNIYEYKYSKKIKN